MPEQTRNSDSVALCGARAGESSTLTCLKPAGHDGRHATCLGYHPEPYDEYEWAEWDSE